MSGNQVAIKNDGHPDLTEGMKVKYSSEVYTVIYDSDRQPRLLNRNCMIMSDPPERLSAVTLSHCREYSTDNGVTWLPYAPIQPAIDVPKELFVNLYPKGFRGGPHATMDAAVNSRGSDCDITQRYVPAPNWKKCVKGTNADCISLVMYDAGDEELVPAWYATGTQFDRTDRWHCPLPEILAMLPKD
jgi:hypothetical protein